MSRIGKQPVIIPEKTDVSVSGNTISVKGPFGELTRSLHEAIVVTVQDKKVIVTPANNSSHAQALWGTYASHIKNMVQGVNQVFEKKLILEGIGFRVNIVDSSSGKSVELIVGFSHKVLLPIPQGITVVLEKNNILISGPSKEQVGQFTAEVRAVKKPEPYKGKGIRYADEVIRRKQGKKTVG